MIFIERLLFLREGFKLIMIRVIIINNNSIDRVFFGRRFCLKYFLYSNLIIFLIIYEVGIINKFIFIKKKIEFRD